MEGTKGIFSSSIVFVIIFIIFTIVVVISFEEYENVYNGIALDAIIQEQFGEFQAFFVVVVDAEPTENAACVSVCFV